MSYDLRLFRKDTKLPFSESEVKDGLKGSFKHISTVAKENQVFTFEVGDDSLDDLTAFHHNDNLGCYGTYCSYSVSPEVFNNFKSVVKVVAESLEMLIQDPQIGDDLMDPSDFELDSEQSSRRFGFTQGMTNKIIEKLPHMLPTKTKQFILYFIMSSDPVTNEELLLALEGDTLYASKVEPGESVYEVVKREIPQLTGANEFKIIEVLDHDIIKDNQGNQVPRFAIYIEVPHFDPNTRNTNKKVHWSALP